jgi:3'(2'), 5'-bisphosphate nucleotidase
MNLKFTDRYRHEAGFAVGLGMELSRLARTVQDQMVTPALEKSDRSPVTIADLAVQALAAYRLGEEFPGEPLVGEESSAVFRETGQTQVPEVVAGFVSQFEPSTTPQRISEWIDRGLGEPSGRFWLLDPVDGTKGFLRGDQYAIALTLMENGTPRVGVLGCPRLVFDVGDETLTYAPGAAGSGCLLVAVRGEGTWLLADDLERQLRVSNCSSTERVIMLRSVEGSHTNEEQTAAVKEYLGVRNEPLMADSQVKYALLAAGCGDLLLRLLSPLTPDYREKIWDHAAGSLVVEEAGGKVTDSKGVPLDFTQGRRLERNRGLIASNSILHSKALEAVRASTK